MKFLVSVTLLAVSAGLTLAQYDGPVPPRLQIPGAVPIVRGGLPANAFRTDRLVPGEDDGPILARFQPQERPTAVPVQLARFNPQPAAPQKIAHRPTPAAYRQHDHEEQQQQQPQRVREPVRPTPRYNNHDNEREKKPVAQILRKYREEHEDGTITWGFENDDGSFKEETIGIDCVTRGRYGYVDPDGNKREYSYETGIQCDPNKRDEEELEEPEEQEFVPQVKHFKRPQQQRN